MKHIQTFEQINEGVVGDVVKKVKKFLGFNPFYRVSYTTKVDDERHNSYFTCKAKSEDAAEEKFNEAWEKATKGMKPKLEASVYSVKETDTNNKSSIVLPKHKEKKK